MAQKGLFQHIPMGNYHKFRHAYEVEIEKWCLIG